MKISKEVTKSERMYHTKKLFSFEEMYALSIYKVRQNYFPFEHLSALVYTARWRLQDFHQMF